MTVKDETGLMQILCAVSGEGGGGNCNFSSQITSLPLVVLVAGCGLFCMFHHYWCANWSAGYCIDLY